MISIDIDQIDHDAMTDMSRANRPVSLIGS